MRILLIERWAEMVSLEMFAEENLYHWGTVHDLDYSPSTLQDACFGDLPESFTEMLVFPYLSSLAEPAAEERAGSSDRGPSSSMSGIQISRDGPWSRLRDRSSIFTFESRKWSASGGLRRSVIPGSR